MHDFVFNWVENHGFSVADPQQIVIKNIGSYSYDTVLFLCCHASIFIEEPV